MSRKAGVSGSFHLRRLRYYEGDMIYLKSTTDPQVVRIPANGSKSDAAIVTLEMVNTINLGGGTAFGFDRRVYLIDAEGAFVHDADGLQIAVAATPETSRLYYVIRVALPEDMPEGEYEYTARVGDETVSCGLAIVGSREPSLIEYENTAQYEQYKQD